MTIESLIKKATLKELFNFQEQIRTEIKHRLPPEEGSAEVVTFTDGASRGNPGLAGVGVLLYDKEGKIIKEDCQFLGVCTNNEAEYRALMLALDHAAHYTKESVSCFLDSQLTVRQMTGEYQIKSEKLLFLKKEVEAKLKKFKQVSFTHVPREHPKLQLADKLANKAIDQHERK
jgi:ribonuclease HI